MHTPTGSTADYMNEFVLVQAKQSYLIDIPELDRKVITSTGQFCRAYWREINRPSPLPMFTKARELTTSISIPKLKKHSNIMSVYGLFIFTKLTKQYPSIKFVTNCFIHLLITQNLRQLQFP